MNAVVSRTLSPRSTEAVLRVAVWCAFLVVLSFTSADPDLWGHVRFGMDILRDGHMPQFDTYSFASDRLWINHEWGAEVLAAAAYELMGNAGLVLLKLMLVCPVLLFLDRALRCEGVHSTFARDIASGAAILVTLSQAHHVRPQLFSLLLFSILLYALLDMRRGRVRTMYLLPLVFAAWANLHGGWIVGGAVLAIWTAALLVTGERRLVVVSLGVGGVSLLATLLTPYGVTLWGFLRETVGFQRPEILEWQPVYVTGWPFVVLWVIALLIVALGIRLEAAHSIPLERMAVVVALGIASFKVSRLLAFFGLAAVFFFAPAIGRAYQRRQAARRARPTGLFRFGFLLVGTAVGVMAVAFVRNNLWQLRLDSASMPEAQAISALADQPGRKRVLVWFNWGEYAIWHLPSRMQVSIDGRRETVYSDRLQTRHFDFFYDRPGGAALPDDLAADYIWIPRVLPVAQRLHSDPHWFTLYEGDQSVIFARSGIARQTPAPQIASISGVPRFFPGP
jgi:hypothetical protein